MKFLAINKSVVPIPADGIIRLVAATEPEDSGGQPVHDAFEPDAGDPDQSVYAINDSGDVSVDGEFVALSFDEATHVLVDSENAPAFAQSCGPYSGFEASTDGTGLVCVSDVSNRNVRFLSAADTGNGTGAGGSGDCGCCESVEFPDTILTDGTKTTSQRKLCSQLGPIKYRYSWGTLTITLPEPDDMILTREEADPETDNFIWEMTEDIFSAVYSDGTDATGDLVEPSGSVIFNHTLPVDQYDCGCPQMRLRIEWDVDEPIPDAGSAE